MSVPNWGVKLCTENQLNYINFLLEKHDNRGTLEDVISEIDPDLGEEEDFAEWIRRQGVGRASEVIEILKENL